MRYLFITLISLLSSLACAESLDAVISSHGHHFIDLPQDAMLRELKQVRLTWNNENHTQIRFSRSISNDEFTFAGQQITEAVFNFDDRKHLQNVQLSIYNRGDCGSWTNDNFKSTLASLRTAICEMTKVRQPEESARKLPEGNVRQFLWHAQGHDMALRCCSGDNGPEYINVIIAPRRSLQSLRQEIKTSVKANELVRNVRKESQGVRWIDVPMVNQGDKGYCLVAVMERMMRYYNSSIDQHIIAQMMEADAQNGTNLSAGMDALEKCESKLRIKVKKLYDDKSFRTFSGLEKMLGDYNKLAKKSKLPQLDMNAIRQSRFNVKTMFSDIDKDTFIAMRQKRKPSADSFFITIKNEIDRGMPLVWSVLILPDELSQQPQASFHARIINGYNPTTREVIYTDSWGPGHEKKTMPLDKAWACTTTLLKIQPM